LLAPATDNSELHVVAQRRQRSSKVFAGATGASCKAPRACTSVIAAGRPAVPVPSVPTKVAQLPAQAASGRRWRSWPSGIVVVARHSHPA